MEQRVNILVVDDHQIVIDGIKSMLAESDIYSIVAQALNAESAWNLVHSNSLAIDIVITDISMGAMSGIDLCRKIKTFNSNIKVMILSMYNQIDYIRQALNCEADGYILKNSGRSEFIKALDALTQRGAYFAHEIIPILYQQVKSKAQEKDKIKLSQRELDVLELILQEFTSKEIADKLFISKQTVDSHRISIMEKTSSKSVVGLIKFALREGILKIG
jgi:DNA-binding NarL/FixJ family response regulator